jgi:hypothetical protein
MRILIFPWRRAAGRYEADQLHAVGWGGVSAEHVEARPGAYADSVTLMQASTDVRKADGVEAALIAMATELNLGLLAEMGFAAPPQAGPNDLLIAVRAKDDATLAGALVAVDTALAPRPRRRPGGAGLGWCWSRCRDGTRSPRRWTRSTPAATS